MQNSAQNSSSTTPRALRRRSRAGWARAEGVVLPDFDFAIEFMRKVYSADLERHLHAQLSSTNASGPPASAARGRAPFPCAAGRTVLSLTYINAPATGIWQGARAIAMTLKCRDDQSTLQGSPHPGRARTSCSTFSARRPAYGSAWHRGNRCRRPPAGIAGSRLKARSRSADRSDCGAPGAGK